MCIGKRNRIEKVCPVCNGTGLDLNDDNIDTYGDDCYYCNGEGIVIDEQIEVDGEYLHIEKE